MHISRRISYIRKSTYKCNVCVCIYIYMHVSLELVDICSRTSMPFLASSHLKCCRIHEHNGVWLSHLLPIELCVLQAPWILVLNDLLVRSMFIHDEWPLPWCPAGIAKLKDAHICGETVDRSPIWDLNWMYLNTKQQDRIFSDKHLGHLSLRWWRWTHVFFLNNMFQSYQDHPQQAAQNGCLRWLASGWMVSAHG